MSLSPSQRIFYMKEIAKRLDVENWTVIDLTLAEFGFPTSSTWNGTTVAYIMMMVKGQDDSKLVNLGTHLGYKPEFQTGSFMEPSFWEEGKLRIFLSHLAKHKGWTSELQVALAKLGITAFVAHSDIKPTLEWQDQIEMALSTCDGLIALLHPDFHKSFWTDQEIGFAMGRGVPIFSVRLGEDPYGFIGKTQAFQGHDKEPYELADELFQALRSHKQTKSKMRDVLLRLFVNSGSFAQAKTRIGYLEEFEFWEPDFAERIRTAALSNSQINGSWGVTDRVETLAKKWEGA